MRALRLLIRPRLSFSARSCSGRTSSLTNTSSAVAIQSDTNKLSVCLVGQPNVGKSTLFNRLCRSNPSIVSPLPGTTRDRIEGHGAIAGLSLSVTDTGGYDDESLLYSDVLEQTKKAVARADVILFMVDGKYGLSSVDFDFASWLRKTLGSIEQSADSSRREVILVANKVEGSYLSSSVLDSLSESSRLGFGDPVLMSAANGDGMADLATKLLECAEERDINIESLPEDTTAISLEERPIQVAFMGKPNVGKSSLLNAILNDQRTITGPSAGVTRDAIYVDWVAFGRRFILVDTAGIVRSKIGKRLSSNKKLLSESKAATSKNSSSIVQIDSTQQSQFLAEKSVQSALHALRYAQVVVLVIEGQQGHFTTADLKIARKCADEGRALVVCANKRDLVMKSGLSARQYEKGVREHATAFLRDFGEVPIVSTAAVIDNGASAGDLVVNLPNQGVDRLLRTIVRTHDAWSSRIDTWILNRWLKDIQISTPPPRAYGRMSKIKYMTQVKIRPPTFAFFGNREVVSPTYSKFIRNRLQSDFNLGGIPIRLLFRRSSGKSADASKIRFSKKKWVKNAGESRPLGAKRDNKYLEMKRKLAQIERRRQTARRRRMTRKRTKY